MPAWGEDNVALCNCAGCGCLLLGQEAAGRHLSRAYRLVPEVFCRMADEERPLADHSRPYCRECVQGMKNFYGIRPNGSVYGRRR